MLTMQKMEVLALITTYDSSEQAQTEDDEVNRPTLHKYQDFTIHAQAVENLFSSSLKFPAFTV